MTKNEAHSLNALPLNYASPRPNQSWIWITLASLANIAFLIALANLWLPYPIRIGESGTHRTFGHFRYAEISTNLYSDEGPIWQWDRLIWHPPAVSISLMLTVALIIAIIWSIAFTLRRIRNSL